MPRRFTFRLQPVLEMRERAERGQQLRVAALERERLEVEGRLGACQDRIIEARDDLRQHMRGERVEGAGGAVSIVAVRMQSQASLHMVALARRMVLELAGVHERLKSGRAELATAQAARKAVSLLRERQLTEWTKALAKAEAQELDELVVMRHGRRDANL